MDEVFFLMLTTDRHAKPNTKVFSALEHLKLTSVYIRLVNYISMFAVVM